jgi:aspartate beta-hydroxylase
MVVITKETPSVMASTAKDLIARASALLQEGKADESAGLIRKAIAQDPDSAEAHNFLGAALQSLGTNEEALACHDKALSLDSGNLDALLLRGRALQALGRGAEAIKDHEAVLAEVPENPRAQFWAATALEGTGRNEEAFVRYRNAATIDPRFAEHLSKALTDDDQRNSAVAKAGKQRLSLYVSSFMTNQGNPRMGQYPGLSSAPFHDIARLPGALALEQNYEAVRAEIANLATTEFQAEAEGLKERGSWDVFLFYERGRKNQENCTRCPVITRLIESQNTVRTQAGLLYVSKLNPGTHIKAHRGPTNLRLRCHLGIKIPDGDCGLKVGGETRRWQEGRCLVFDDSLEHEAWNHALESRIVLIIDFWHPDLTATEIAFLEGLHRYATFQAVSLTVTGRQMPRRDPRRERTMTDRGSRETRLNRHQGR